MIVTRHHGEEYVLSRQGNLSIQHAYLGKKNILSLRIKKKGKISNFSFRRERLLRTHYRWDNRCIFPHWRGIHRRVTVRFRCRSTCGESTSTFSPRIHVFFILPGSSLSMFALLISFFVLEFFLIANFIPLSVMEGYNVMYSVNVP